MEFKPQRWLLEGKCPYCESTDVEDIDEDTDIGDNEVIRNCVCINCQVNFEVCYELNSIVTDRGDKYINSRIYSVERKKHNELIGQLNDLKLRIADVVIRKLYLDTKLLKLINDVKNINLSLKKK
jgi:hypothetical protein